MATYRLTFRYKLISAKWSEVFYFTSDAAPKAVSNFGLPGIDALLAPRAKGTTLVSITAADVQNLRRFARTRYNRVAPGIASASQKPDVPGVTCLLEATGVNGALRKIALRGIQDFYSSRDIQGVDELFPTFKDRLDLYCATVDARGAGLQIQVRNQPAPGTSDPRVLSIIPDPTNANWARVSAALPLPALNSSVAFLGISERQAPGLKGVFKVIGGGADYFLIPYSVRQTVSPINPQLARYRVLNYTYQTIAANGIEFVGWRTRDTANPTDGTRGRGRAGQRRRWTPAGG